MPETSPIYAGRPEVYLADNIDLTLTANLLSLKVEETTDGLYTCEAVFNNWGPKEGKPDFLFLDRKILDFGKTLSFEAGDKEAKGIIFKGRIMAMEAQYPEEDPPRLLILADDRLQDLRMTRRTRSFEDMSDKDIMEKITREYSLTPDINVEGPSYPAITQVNQSDLAFLRERARAIDAQLWLDENKLYIHSRGKRNKNKVEFVYKKRLLSVSIRADLAHQRTSLVIGGWDFNAKEEIKVKAAETAVSAELKGKTSGSTILKKAIGEREEYIVHKSPFTMSEGKYLAEGNYRVLARKFLTGTGVSDGDARIKAGTWVDLSGLEKMFDGEYFVTGVCHMYDTVQGFRTKFSIERPWLGDV